MQHRARRHRLGDLKFNRFVFAVPAYRLEASKRQAWLNSIPQKNELLDTKKIANEDRENVLDDVRNENHPYNDHVNFYLPVLLREDCPFCFYCVEHIFMVWRNVIIAIKAAVTE